MTTVLHLPGRIPTDSFPTRLAIVRAEMGWNYDQAARATGLNSETWRLWEKHKRQCTSLEATCRIIADATGYSYEWLMIGGALSSPDPRGPAEGREWAPSGSNRRPTDYKSAFSGIAPARALGLVAA